MIDNLLTNCDLKIQSGVLVEDSISDHFPIFNMTEVKLDTMTHKATHFVSRIITQERADEFSGYLKDEFAHFDRHVDVNTAAAHFMDTITGSMNRFFPSKRYLRKTTPKNPWMTNGILVSVNAKNKLYKIYLHERTHESQQRYKRYRNVLIGAIREAKKNYYQKLC